MFIIIRKTMGCFDMCCSIPVRASGWNFEIANNQDGSLKQKLQDPNITCITGCMFYYMHLFKSIPTYYHFSLKPQPNNPTVILVSNPPPSN